MQIAEHDVEHSAAAQGEQHHKLHHRKTAAELLGGGLGIDFVVWQRVGQLRGGTVGHFDRTALQVTAGADTPVGCPGRQR